MRHGIAPHRTLLFRKATFFLKEKGTRLCLWLTGNTTNRYRSRHTACTPDTSGRDKLSSEWGGTESHSPLRAAAAAAAIARGWRRGVAGQAGGGGAGAPWPARGGRERAQARRAIVSFGADPRTVPSVEKEEELAASPLGPLASAEARRRRPLSDGAAPLGAERRRGLACTSHECACGRRREWGTVGARGLSGRR